MDKVFVGSRVSDLDTGGGARHISRVILRVDGETQYTAGDDAGQTLEKSCPWGTQEMCESILRQVRGVESIATMESASPAAVKIIEAEMEKKFSSMLTTSNVKVGGIDYVAGIMNNLDRSSEKAIFDRLGVNNAELADEIRKRMFVFEDIVTMDDRSVQRFVRDCDPRDLVLALKSANGDVSNKLFMNMSARMAESIRDDLEITTNVRMKDVEDAQQRIVGIIRDLEEKNEIVILKGGKDDIIA